MFLLFLARQFARQLNIEKAKVITISGFRKTGEFEITNDDTEPTVQESS